MLKGISGKIDYKISNLQHLWKILAYFLVFSKSVFVIRVFFIASYILILFSDLDFSIYPLSLLQKILAAFDRDSFMHCANRCILCIQLHSGMLIYLQMKAPSYRAGRRSAKAALDIPTAAFYNQVEQADRARQGALLYQLKWEFLRLRLLSCLRSFRKANHKLPGDLQALST